MAPIRFLKPRNILEEGGRNAVSELEGEVELERVCPNCRKSIALSRLYSTGQVCPCGHHFRISARQRIRFFSDKGSFQELDANLTAGSPIGFPGYAEKIEAVRAASQEKEAVICGTATIHGKACFLFVMEPFFMMGSMGAAVGEKITRVFERATEARLPVIGFAASGGARMQEGLVSLMQMAKTSAAVKAHSDAGLFYACVLTDPTTGGVSASFAMQADIILAEPEATVGFAGRRVIEQATRKALPKGFQKAEFVLQHGFVDNIVPRGEQKDLMAKLIGIHDGGWAHGADDTL